MAESQNGRLKVVWTEQALERLQEIEDYISHNSPETAMRFIEKLLARGDALKRFSRSGRQVPELGSSELREFLEGNYRIVYRVCSRRIEILTVFEGHQQLPVGDIPPRKA